MEKKKDHFRAPVQDTFRKKSPFGQLLEHMGKVKECIDLLGDGLVRYYKGDYKNFSELAKKVSEIEHEADLIKSNIRNHLPKHLFMIRQQDRPIRQRAGRRGRFILTAFQRQRGSR